MAKKNGFNPFIILSQIDPGSGEVSGGGTGQYTTDPYACDYTEWLSAFAEDVDNSGSIDFEDYRVWFIATFGDEAEDLWDLFNDEPLKP